MTKKIATRLFAAAIAIVLCSMAMVNSSGKAGYTGSPGETTCATSGCHSTYPLNSGIGSVSISVNGMTGWQYVPGQVYTVNVTVAYQGRSLFGFGFEALQSSGANAGTLTAGSGSHALFANIGGNLRTNMTHLSGGGASPNSKTFTFTWTAPATSVGNVTFYVSGLCANGTGGTNDDYVYNTSQVLTPLVPPSPPTISSSAGNTLCPDQSTTLSLTPQDGLTYTWYLNGTSNVGNGNSISINTAGCYTAIASGTGGNSSPSNQICVTISNPNASFSGLQSTYCISDTPSSLSPVQSGGSFNGPGVSSLLFNPQSAGTGTHSITYAITDNNGCSATTTQSTVVYPDVNAFFDIPISFCSNASPFALVPVQSGGNFSGAGVSGNTFNPLNAGAGNASVTYQIANEACQASYTAVVSVFQAPDASFSGLNATYCANDNSSVLSPSSPGGVFAGPGITDNTFSPVLAGVGLHDINYTVSNSQCTASSTSTVSVSESFEATFSGLSLTSCTTDTPVALIPVEQGGIFSGPGVSGSFFNPSVAGPGTHTVVYNIGSGDCAATDSVSVICYEGPTVSLNALNPICANAPAVPLSAAPPGGVFSGPGVSNDSFNPAITDIGQNIWYYTYIDSNGCTVTDSSLVEVKPLPNVALNSANNNIVVAQQSAEYTWVDCATGIAIPGATAQTFAFTQSGSYACIVLLNGCSANSECLDVQYVSVDEPSSLDIRIYPNPNKGSVTIAGVQDGCMRIFNMSGQLIATEKIVATNKVYSGFPSAGNYIVEVVNQGKTKRFVVSVIPE